MNMPVFARQTLSIFLGAALLLAVHASTSFAAEEKADDLIKLAQAAMQKNDLTGALELMNKAVKAEPKNAQAWFALGRVHAAMRQHDKAAAAYGKALEASPQASPLYMHRGMELFKDGRIKECVEDFDNYNKLVPNGAAQNWQRGIALYYAGRFADGKKQFELHQTVNKQDVENAVWHFLCTARAEGLDKARAQLIPISGDSRIPMAQVHQLFAGKAKPEDVLAAARAGEPPPDRQARQLFYAHLYLGIYFEAIGDAKQARDHIFKAAEKADQNDYMGDVARVHADILRKQEKK